MNQVERGNWSNRFGFIMAASGSAVGLGNIWKFPYVTGVHGGGAFVLMYLLCIMLIGLPVMLAEFTIGRSTQLNPVGAFRKLEGKKSLWDIIGFMGVLSAFIILSYYCVVAGWILDYVYKAFTGAFSFGQSSEAISSMLGQLLGNGTYQVILLGIFLLLNLLIVMMGVKSGIEKASIIMMPLLVLILIGLVAYSTTLEGFEKALSFLFAPNFDKLTPQGLLEGLGHAFFTLSLGMGAMITYGSYTKKEQKLLPSALWIIGMDTSIALLAGILIFSIVFTFGLEPGAGPTLIFSTLPALFTKLAGGTILSIAFFILLLFAALTSSISLLEVVVSYLVDSFSWQRKITTVGVTVVAFIVGILSALSENVLNSVKLPLTFLFGAELTFFDSFDKLSSNIMLPLGGLLIALYVGWKMSDKVLISEFSGSHPKIVPVLRFILRFVAPLLVTLVFGKGIYFLNSLFI